MIRVLAVGDIMGKAGRRCLDQLLGKIRQCYKPDFVVVNGENAAGGFGLTEKIYRQFTDKWTIDAVTMGNHWHDKRDIYKYHPSTDRLVLPGNMANVEDEAFGLRIIDSVQGAKIAVINLIGQAFMKGENRSPFETVDRLLATVPADTKIRIVDFHAEATSEKQALGRYLAGRVSLVYGTHSHVPTADDRILDDHTGYATDLGMTGGYDSVIGIRKEAAISRLLTGNKGKWEPATGDPWLCGVLADVDESTGRCLKLERLRFELDRLPAELLGLPDQSPQGAGDEREFYRYGRPSNSVS